MSMAAARERPAFTPSRCALGDTGQPEILRGTRSFRKVSQRLERLSADRAASLLTARNREGSTVSGAVWGYTARSCRESALNQRPEGMNRFMVRYLAWIANTVLFALCCFLIADTANAIIAALLNPSPATSVVAGQPSGLQSRSWNDRQQITDRNLFHSEVLSPPEQTATTAAAANEELTETNLPLKLWGTIAANDPALSWASVEDTGRAVTSAVRVGDKIQSASIVAIERRRVVLLENGARRSLSLDGEEAPDSALQVSRRSTPPTRAAGARPPRRSSARSSDPAAQAVAPPMGNPNSLYSQARVKPQIDLETNQITGLELSNIQAGSVFEAVGIQNGEVITEVDGVPVSQLGPSTKIMSALSDPEQVEIVTVDPSGNSHHRVIVPPR